MPAIGALLTGLLNIAIYIAILIFVGLIIVWLLQALAGIAVPGNIQQIYMVIVALIAVYMIVALLFGLPSPFRPFV